MSDEREMSREEAAAELQRLIGGFRISQAIHVAAVLRVADQMAAGPRKSDEIAAAVGAHPRSLYRLLRALASIGVFREHEGERFSLTAMGELLRSDVEDSLEPWAVFVGQEYRWQAWGHLLHSVQTGENAFRAVHGTESWVYRERHPEQNAICNAAMTSSSRHFDRTIVAAYHFGQFARIADIGGGQGSFLAAILAANPDTRGVLFDLPHVVATAAPVLEAAGVADRCEIMGGNMFESAPTGCSAYVMKFVIHDWQDAECVSILETCRRAMPAEARLLVIERLVGPPNSDPPVKFADLEMLVGPGGRERTREEFAKLFRRGGFRLVEATPTSGTLTVLVGQAR